MATETTTGMDRAEMKRLLIKSKQEPVNCALGVGDDKSVALLMLSPHRSAKSLQGDLQKDFPTAFNTRFGTAVVDTDDDPTLVKFMINKAVSSMARRLVKTLKGTGFRKVQLLLEDGSPVETAAEEEGAEQAGIGASGADSATGAPSPSPSPQAAPQPDAAALAAALAIQVPRIAEVADPTQKEALAKQARVANVNIKTGNLVYAATGIEQLRRALDAIAAPAGSNSGAGQSAPSMPPPPPPPPPTAEVQPDPAALAAALAVLIPRVAQVTDPAQKEALSKQAREANVNIKTGNLVYAATGIEQLRRALDAMATLASASEFAAEQSAQSAPPTASPPPPIAPQGSAGAVAYGKARLAWLATRSKMESDIEKLKGELLATYGDRAPDLEGRYHDRVAPVLELLDESLADKLDEATNTEDPEQRSRRVGEAREIIARYETFLASDPIIADLDSNPFVPLAIQQTVATTLATLAKTVR